MTQILLSQTDCRIPIQRKYGHHHHKNKEKLIKGKKTANKSVRKVKT